MRRRRVISGGKSQLRRQILVGCTPFFIDDRVDSLQGGYAPPGSVVAQTLVTVSNDPSGNYAS
jgi:hypothetical protein